MYISGDDCTHFVGSTEVSNKQPQCDDITEENFSCRISSYHLVVPLSVFLGVFSMREPASSISSPGTVTQSSSVTLAGTCLI